MLVDVVLHDLHLAAGEHVGLHRRRQADDARDRVAVSISEETTKSTSRRPSRHSSMYSMLEVRMTVVARGASILANVAATRLASSRDVHAITRSASATPASARAAARAVRLDRDDVVPVGERRQPPRVEIDHGQVVLGVERLNDRGADLARADDEDLHGGGRVHPPVRRSEASATVSSMRRFAVLPAALLVVVALAMCASASSGRAGALGLVRVADGLAVSASGRRATRRRAG